MLGRARPIRSPKSILVLLVLLAVTAGLVVVMASDSDADGGPRVILVNQTRETLWIGSGVNADGSEPIVGLPELAPGGRATVLIPYGKKSGAADEEARKWRGRFFARQRCTGVSGADFRCAVADCGPFKDRCTTGNEPASLAEFNFDDRRGAGGELLDPGAPWYNVSYVDAVSLAVTIDRPGGERSDAAGTCVQRRCDGGQLLAACTAAVPAAPGTPGERLNCVNPNRDAETAYTHAMRPFGVRAYLWSTHDREPGNLTMYNCQDCDELVITFRGGPMNAAPTADPVPTTTTAAPKPTVTSTAGPEPTSTRPAPTRPAPTREPRSGPAPVRTPPAVDPGVDAFVIRGIDGTYENKCVGVPWSRPYDGAQLRLGHCSPSPALEFTAGTHGTLKVLGKCLTVAGGGSVRLEKCAGSAAQGWEVSGKTLRHAATGRCLDADVAEVSSRAGLQVRTCGPAGQDNQSWRLVEY